jgi:uncharacterized protein (DUF1800 family)
VENEAETELAGAPSGETTTPDAPSAETKPPDALSAEQAAHLLRRTRFAARPEDVQAWTGRTWDEAISTLVDAAPDPVLTTPKFVYQRPGPDDNDTDAALLLSTEIDRLAGSVGLGDRLLWFWHGVFTSSQSAVDQPALLFRQHQLLARHSLGSLRQLIIDISTDPGMLVFLNGDGSSIDAPNENYSRELMELFTLGRGTYTQAEVVAGARVLAGWEVLDVPERPGRYDPALMRAVYTGNSAGGIPGHIDRILARPACAAFLAHKLCATFLQAQPSGEDEAAVAAALRTGGFAVRPALAALFRLPAFRAEPALRGRVRQPLEVLLQTAVAFGVPPTQIGGADYLEAAGQVPFDPPNVAGWPLDPRWLTSPEALARVNIGLQAYALPANAAGITAVAAAQDPIGTALQRAGVFRASDRTRTALRQVAAANSDGVSRARALLALAIASPEMGLT